MNKKTLSGIAYVSAWVIVWGTIGSLIDFPLLQANIYIAGSLGQLLTFSITGVLSIVMGIYLFPKIFNNKTDKED